MCTILYTLEHTNVTGWSTWSITRYHYFSTINNEPRKYIDTLHECKGFISEDNEIVSLYLNLILNEKYTVYICTPVAFVWITFHTTLLNSKV